MKKWKRMTAGLLCACTILTMCACGSTTKEEDEISKTLNNFVTACVDSDIQGMLDCIDPNISNLVSAVGGLVSDFTDVDFDTMLSLLSEFGYMESIENGNALSSLKLDVQQVNIAEDGNSATAVCSLSYEENGQSESETFDAYLVKKNDAWYISEQW